MAINGSAWNPFGRSSPGPPASPFKGFGTQTENERLAAAEAAGYKPVLGKPGMVSKQLPSNIQTPAGWRTNNLSAPVSLQDDRFNTTTMFGQLKDATRYDHEALQRIAAQSDMQLENDLGKVEAALDAAPGNIRGAGEGAIKQLEGDATGLRELGDKQVSEFDTRAKGIVDERRKGEDAEVAALTQGLNRRYQSEMQTLKSGLNSDGTLMTPEQSAARRMELKQEVDTNLGSLLVQKAAQFRNDIAGLQTNLEQLRGGVLGGQRDLYIAAANIGSMIGNIMQTNELEATQLELSGRMALADYRRQNPKSHVSLFTSLANLYSIGTAPGSNRKGISF